MSLAASRFDLISSSSSSDSKKRLLLSASRDSPICASSSKSLASSSSSSFAPCSSPCSAQTAHCMRQGRRETKTGSMRVKSLIRCGFGVKYSGFLHIRGRQLLFLFLRLAHFT